MEIPLTGSGSEHHPSVLVDDIGRGAVGESVGGDGGFSVDADVAMVGTEPRIPVSVPCHCKCWPF